MKITITAELIPEYVDILSKSKWYEELIYTMTENWFITSENPQSKEDFIRQVYQSMIKNDAINVFLEYARIQRQEAERVENEKISQNIDNAITSKVE